MNDNTENPERDIKVFKKLEEKAMANPFNATAPPDLTEKPSNNNSSNDSTREDNGKVDE